VLSVAGSDSGGQAALLLDHVQATHCRRIVLVPGGNPSQPAELSDVTSKFDVQAQPG
jgi:hypothetical protein